MSDDVLFCHGGVVGCFVENMVLSDIYHNADEAIDFISGLYHALCGVIYPLSDFERSIQQERYRSRGDFTGCRTYSG